MAENIRRRFNITPPPSSTPVAARPPRVEVQEADQVRRSQLTLEDVPGLERPLTAGPNDRIVGQDEFGRTLYETATGQQYSVDLNPDQRTGRQRFEEDTLPAIQEYIENPTLPSAEQVVDFAVGVGQSVYQQIDDAVSGQGTLGSALELMPQIAAISATQRVPEGAIRIFGGFNKAVDPAVDEAGRRLPITIGADGLRRFEIDDSVASFVPDNVRAMDVDSQWNNLDLETTDQLSVNRRPYSFVDEVIEHPELFRQYPELKDIRVVVDTALKSPHNGYFSPTRNLIAVSRDVASDPRQFAAVLLHEIQHGVQKQEGFDLGASPALDDYEVTNRALPDLTVIQNRRNTAVDLIQEYDFDSSVNNITSFLDDMIAEREGRLGIPDYADRTIREDLERKLEVLRENPLNTQARSDLALAMRNFFDSFRENQGRVPRELRERFRNDFGISLGELEGTPKNRVDYLLELNTVIPIRPERYDDALSDIRFDTYEGRSGEIESRNVSNRMDLSLEDRFDLPPGQFFDREARRLASRGNLTNPGPWRVDAEGNILEAQTPRQVGGLSAAIGNFIARRRGNTNVDTPDQSSTSMSSASTRVPEDDFDYPPAENARDTQRANTIGTYRRADELLNREFGEGKTLDFSAGLGLSERELGFDTYEPFPREGFNPMYTSADEIPDESYDRLVNLNTLNVVPRSVRDGIVRDIGRVLRPGGVGIITTRGSDVMKSAGRPGPEPMSLVTSGNTYQKGFTQPELREYIQEILGDGFEVTSNDLGKAGVTIRKLSEERGFNKGGLAMDDQMKNLLEEGGLTDDGMKKDPVSGNDVPSGSMAEEVRDDIDARLSEGEYVVPADVVRYYGVKFFEDLRGQAKEDLNDMEESGRIGGEPVEMAAGGMVPTTDFRNSYITAQTPNMQQPQGYAVGGMVGDVVNNVLNTASTTTPTDTQDQNMYLQTPYSSLSDLFADFSQVGGYTQRITTGAPAPTVPTTPTTPTTPDTTGNIEYRTYVGPNGQLIMIPFLNGEPQIPIPAGFVPQGQAPQVSSGDNDDSGPKRPQTTEERLAEIDAALEDVNYEDPLTAGAEALEGNRRIGTIAGSVIGSLLLGPIGGLLGRAVGQVSDNAGMLADAAVNAEVANILGYDSTDLDSQITSKIEETSGLARRFTENAVSSARLKAREAIFNVDSPYALTREKFQSDEAFESAMTEVAPTGMTYQPDTGGYTRDDDSPTVGERTGRQIDTSDSGNVIYAPTSTTPRPVMRPANLGTESASRSNTTVDYDDSNVGKWGGDRDGDGVPNWRDFNDGVGTRDNNSDGSGSTEGSGKIVCTAMNASYGFGSYRQAIWLKYSADSLTEYHEKGYHKIFLPLVDRAYNRGENNSMFIRKVLENIARHRTADLRAEMQGKKRDKVGRVYRAVLEPICYVVGRLSK